MAAARRAAHDGEPTLERIDEARHARRLSAKAKKLGKRRATELGWADEHDMPSEWSEDVSGHHARVAHTHVSTR